MPGGRPSLYRPAYCEAVAGFHTVAALGRHIGVDTTTLYRWAETYPEFAEALRTMTRHHPGLLYHEDYCDDVIDFLKDGHSLAAFGGHIGVSRETLYRWMRTQPAFAEAVKRAQAKSILWWERRILELAQTGQGSAAAITFGLKNRAPEDWRDKSHTELTGAVEQIHRIERVIVRPGHLDGDIAYGRGAAIE
jgi:transposase-like protein